jgi:hypothetical protein
MPQRENLPLLLPHFDVVSVEYLNSLLLGFLVVETN